MPLYDAKGHVNIYLYSDRQNISTNIRLTTSVQLCDNLGLSRNRGPDSLVQVDVR